MGKLCLRKRNIVVFGVSAYLIMSVMLLIGIIGFEKRVREANFEYLKEHEASSVQLAQELITNEFAIIASDITYLMNLYSYDTDSNDITEYTSYSWEEFLQVNPIYQSIRFIDSQGIENTLIKYDNGSVYIETNTNLNNVENEDYYINAKELNEGEIYISHLNFSSSKEVSPGENIPVSYFSTAVYNDSGEFEGVIVLEYILSNVIGTFVEVSGHSTGDMLLFNADSHIISPPDKDKDWQPTATGWENIFFSDYYPEVWEAANIEYGQMLTSDGLFTFYPVIIEADASSKIINGMQVYKTSGERWYVISMVLREGKNSDVFFDNRVDIFLYFVKTNKLTFYLANAVSVIVSLLLSFYFVLNKKTKYYSEFDMLTGVYNRRAGTKKLNEMLAEKMRNNFLLSLCFIDVDGLKEVNDKLGHNAGDELIVTVAEVIKNHIRKYDYIVRMGGDEFLILFARLDKTGAEHVWTRIMGEFNAINRGQNRKYNISASHGIISCVGDACEVSPDSVIKFADEKMYEEKQKIKRNFSAIK